MSRLIQSYLDNRSCTVMTACFRISIIKCLRPKLRGNRKKFNTLKLTGFQLLLENNLTTTKFA